MVSMCQGPPDVHERRVLGSVGLEPVGEVGGGLASTRREESRDHQRDNRTLGPARRESFYRVLFGLGLFGFRRCGRELAQRGAFGFGEELVEVVVFAEEVGDRRLGGNRLVDDLGDGFPQVFWRHLSDHHMGVGAAEPESRDTRDGAARVPGPISRLGDNTEPQRVELDVGVGARVVQRRRELVLLEGKDQLDQACGTSTGFEMAEVRLRRAEQRRLVRIAALADHTTECVCLDGVAENGPRTVRLDVVDVTRIDGSVDVGAAQHLNLSFGIRGRQSVGAPVGVDGRSRDHREHVVTVAAGIGKSFQHNESATLGADHAVGIGRERLDVTVFGLHTH